MPRGTRGMENHPLSGRKAIVICRMPFGLPWLRSIGHALKCYATGSALPQKTVPRNGRAGAVGSLRGWDISIMEYIEREHGGICSSEPGKGGEIWHAVAALRLKT